MQIKQFTQFHENPVVIARWCAWLGWALRHLTPCRRRAILAAAAVWVCFKSTLRIIKSNNLPGPADGMVAALLVALALLAIAWLLYRAAAGFSSLPLWVRKHPQLSLHSMYWGFLVVLWITAPGNGLWRQVLAGVALIFPLLVWRFAYVLLSGQHGRMAGTRFSDHLLTLWPIYGGTNTPYGSGIGYLSRSEAKTEEELARSQLAGIKLLVLCGLWTVALEIMEAVLYGPGNQLTQKLGGYTLAVPKLGRMVAGEAADSALWISWLSIYCELIHQVLRHAIHGHAIIATLRLFGFNVFRNTYKPLLAESIVEFWNRYYYYFKEILANFFFLPTFTQLGRKLRNWPTLRLWAAVFAAAFVGNTYYHLINLERMMIDGQVLEAIYLHRPRMFYCFLLAFGIFVSMLRQQRRGGRALTSGLANRILRIAGVWTFFSLIFIWNVRGGGSFTARTNFFLGLFGFA
jgi:hypothetical protein